MVSEQKLKLPCENRNNRCRLIVCRAVRWSPTRVFQLLITPSKLAHPHILVRLLRLELRFLQLRRLLPYPLGDSRLFVSIFQPIFINLFFSRIRSILVSPMFPPIPSLNGFSIILLKVTRNNRTVIANVITTKSFFIKIIRQSQV